MEAIKCCFACANFLGCRTAVSRRIAFSPPRPSSYTIIQRDGKTHLVHVDDRGSLIFPVEVPWLTTVLTVLVTARGSRIPVLYLQHDEAEFTIIYSHGNSTDIGQVRGSVIDLSFHLKVNILLFEYTGYGASSGKPSEEDTYADIRAAHDYATLQLGIPWNKIILYGQSLGSGPAVDLASERAVAGLILHSPFASGLSLFSDELQVTPTYDLYRNYDKLRYIKSPTFIIHGLDDRVVPVRHGKWLEKSLHFPWPAWWVPEADHNNIEVKFRREYFEHLKDFVAAVVRIQRYFSSENDMWDTLCPYSRQIPVQELPQFVIAWPDRDEPVLEDLTS